MSSKESGSEISILDQAISPVRAEPDDPRMPALPLSTGVLLSKEGNGTIDTPGLTRGLHNMTD